MVKMVIITCGPTGCGKSTLAHKVASTLGIAHLESDVVRKKIFGIPATQHEKPGSELYSAKWLYITAMRMLEMTKATLQKGSSVLVDACHLKKAHRKAVRDIADETGARLIILAFDVPYDEIKTRINGRKPNETFSDADESILELHWSVFENVSDDEGDVVIHINEKTKINDVYDFLKRL